jgi:hypothetical protein
MRMVDTNRITLYVSRATVAEFAAVCAYPGVRRAFPDLPNSDVDAFIRHLLFRAILIRRVRHT